MRSQPQSETGPANSNTASPSVNSAPRGGTVTKRPFSAAVSSKRVKAPELSNSVYGAKSVPTSKFSMTASSPPQWSSCAWVQTT